MFMKCVVAGLMSAALVGCGGGSSKPELPNKEYGPIESDTEVPQGKKKKKAAPDANNQQELKEG